MSNYTVEVPLIKIGNREGFTAQQIEDDPIAREFCRRFSHCFEPHPNPNLDVVLLKATNG